MTFPNKLFTLIIFVAALIFVACSDDDGSNIGVDPEEIKTVLLAISDGTSENLFAYSDPDGNGGFPPEADTIKLAPNTTYGMAVSFLDESGNGVNLTSKILTEADYHLVCYEISNNLMSNLNVTDQDSNGDPLGLQASWVTTDSSEGAMVLSLKVRPDKSVTAPCNTGETAVEATFPVEVE